jgi:hypothetical protein
LNRASRTEQGRLPSARTNRDGGNSVEADDGSFGKAAQEFLGAAGRILAAALDEVLLRAMTAK